MHKMRSGEHVSEPRRWSVGECRICGRQKSAFEHYDPHDCNPRITKEQLAVFNAAMAVHNTRFRRFDRARYDACLAILEGELDKACCAEEEAERG